jgi:hypothetical protein
MLRNVLAIAILFSATAANAQKNYPGGIPGCVARYSFDFSTSVGSTLPDVSGNGNSGTTYFTNPIPGWRGQANQALKFDGASSYALVPDSANLRPQQITMISLVRFDGYYHGNCQYSQILSKGFPGYTSGVYGQGITDNIYDNSCSGFDSLHQMRADYIGPATPTIPQTTPIEASKWYFMASTYEGSRYDGYQAVMDSNNLLSSLSPIITLTNVNTPIGTNTQELAIGRHMNPGYPYWLNGAIDEIAIFNRILTPQEIYKVYYFLHKGYPLDVANVENKAQDIIVLATNGKLRLESLDGSSIGEVMLYDLQGRKLAMEQLNKNNADLDISMLPKEMLFVKIARKNTISTYKVLNF